MQCHGQGFVRPTLNPQAPSALPSTHNPQHSARNLPSRIEWAILHQRRCLPTHRSSASPVAYGMREKECKYSVTGAHPTISWRQTARFVVLATPFFPAPHFLFRYGDALVVKRTESSSDAEHAWTLPSWCHRAVRWQHAPVRRLTGKHAY